MFYTRKFICLRASARTVSRAPAARCTALRAVVPLSLPFSAQSNHQMAAPLEWECASHCTLEGPAGKEFLPDRASSEGSLGAAEAVNTVRHKCGHGPRRKQLRL